LKAKHLQQKSPPQYQSKPDQGDNNLQGTTKTAKHNIKYRNTTEKEQKNDKTP
jgi:hypothetical protein